RNALRQGRRRRAERDLGTRGTARGHARHQLARHFRLARRAAAGRDAVKLALGLLALLFIGVIGAHFLIADRGQVYVSFHGYTLQTSVPVMVLFVIFLYVLVRLIARLIRLPRNVGRAAADLRARRARENLANGLLALDMGDWARGERLLGRSA